MGFFKIGIISFYLGFKTRGVIPTFQMFFEALIDEIYNFKSGMDVSSFFAPDESQFTFKHRAQANFYQPVRVRPFFKMLKSLNIKPTGRFVDIGTGKGKPLFLAHQFGFTKNVGIELVPELCETASKNIKLYLQKHPKTQTKTFTVIQMSGSDYEVSDLDQILFLNDPFDNEIMTLFVNQVTSYLKEAQRKDPLFVIYKNNNKRPMESLLQLAPLGTYKEFNYSGNFFQIYLLNP